MTRDVNDWFKCCSWNIKVDWVGIDQFLLCCYCCSCCSCCSCAQLLQIVLLWLLWFHINQILGGTQRTCICLPYTWLCVLWVTRENNRDRPFIIFLPQGLMEEYLLIYSAFIPVFQTLMQVHLTLRNLSPLLSPPFSFLCFVLYTEDWICFLQRYLSRLWLK